MPNGPFGEFGTPAASPQPTRCSRRYSPEIIDEGATTSSTISPREASIRATCLGFGSPGLLPAAGDRNGGRRRGTSARGGGGRGEKPEVLHGCHHRRRDGGEDRNRTLRVRGAADGGELPRALHWGEGRRRRHRQAASLQGSYGLTGSSWGALPLRPCVIW